VSPTLELDINTFLVAAMLILVGLQSVAFAVIARRFATRYGFIPPSRTFEPVLRALTLERVLIAAMVVVLLGLVALAWGFGQWAAAGFGPLETSSTLRLMIVALTAIVAGVQLMLSGFLNSMIDIPVEEGRLAPAPLDEVTTRHLPGNR